MSWITAGWSLSLWLLLGQVTLIIICGDTSLHWGNHSAKCPSKANINRCDSGTWRGGEQLTGLQRWRMLILDFDHDRPAQPSQKPETGYVTGHQGWGNLQLNVQNCLKYNLLTCFWGVKRSYTLAKGISTWRHHAPVSPLFSRYFRFITPQLFLSEKKHGVTSGSQRFIHRT